MADSGETGSDTQVTFKVKTVGDKAHTITMSESATVLDLKTMLATTDFEDIPVERQRLIYSGRIMKDSDALSVYKIKNNNTIHLVKSARSNPTPATAASSSTPTPAAVPQNMAAGSSASDPLAGLTGARFAGLANLPSADLFGADGGMGAPPNEEQIAEILSNPMVAQTMNEALNNPEFIDYMIRSNPALANVPNAREMLQSPYFRSMMTNPEALRMAGRMRRMMQGDGAAFPAPGATDSTPADAPSSGGSAASGTNQTPGASQANPLAALLGLGPLGMAGPLGGGSAAGGVTAPSGQAAAPSEGGAGSTGAGAGANAQAGSTGQPINPFTALFGLGQGGQAANAASPFGMPPVSPEAMQQMAQMLGLGPLGSLGTPPAPAPAPADDRPPEERYADQLRQLNDMGFFDFDRNVTALRRSGGSVQGAVEYLLSGQ
ncbi:Deubiquitination-protection protein dph1 [Madurella mycetomatis]|uniref:Deubiquitination-protection protein dph1 n=1 Tax=Madurella mycetomatis TaxID=100816 RepID=A0A175W9L1_9PEZI|nr:Deubiquitination-protection protein dph1 [Madurella mycetomatis]